MMVKRDTYKYHVKDGKRIIHSGITNNLERREREYQRKFGDNIYLQKVGNKTTREGAKKWEKGQKRGTP